MRDVEDRTSVFLARPGINRRKENRAWQISRERNVGVALKGTFRGGSRLTAKSRRCTSTEKDDEAARLPQGKIRRRT